MAKEMMIIFVYDTELIKREEDDPASAILYFHPTWVSDQQKTALCGQIIGTCYFLKTTFSKPRIFALQSGKFAIRTYGRYILAVGTDRNVPDWVLNHRANTLTSLISFFHQDLQRMSQLYPETENFSIKLYHMFETYLKILMYGGHMFYNTPTIQIPKGAGYVFLEAMHLLHNCQEMHSVLGGALLYHNKVVATQLSSELTKQLVLTDPYRIKSPAETASVEFKLPMGVQILQVYIDKDEFDTLFDCAKKRKSFSDYCNKKTPKKNKPRENSIKRDQSLIFTTVPEEGTDSHVSPNSKMANRPKFLNLKSKLTDLKPEPKNEITSVPSTPYQGQTSVCSTPITELKRFVHQNVKPLCLDAKESNGNAKTAKRTSTSQEQSQEVMAVNYIPLSINVYDRKRYASMWDIREKWMCLSKRITMKYYNLNFLNVSNNHVEEINARKYHTLADPTNPFRKSNGFSVSSNMYNENIKEHLHSLRQQVHAENKLGALEEKKPMERRKEKKLFELPFLLRKKNPSKGENSSNDRRKSLTLPLKSLTTSEQSEAAAAGSFSTENYGQQALLTPLMSKLSAFDEKSSGFYGRDATPNDHKPVAFTPSQPYRPFTPSVVSKVENSFDKKSSMQQSFLFVCGQQDMVLALLLEHVSLIEDVINKLWDVCTESLSPLEKQLRRCLEILPNDVVNETREIYSYLCMDSTWDSCTRGGPWGGAELGILTHLQRDFHSAPDLTEIILRSEDNVIYGNRFGTTEVFYQQPATNNAGLPPPSDPMGMIVLKARRNLERDHSIVLL